MRPCCSARKPLRAAAVVAAAASKPSRRPPAAGKAAKPARVREQAPEFIFAGSDAGAVEYLVRQGVRPASRAAQRLLDAQRWRAAHPLPPAAAPDADAAGEAGGGAGGASEEQLVRFPQAREAVRLLLDAGVGKKALPRTLELFPGALALPSAELDARLDALDALGLDTPAALGRVLAKAPALLALPPAAAAAAGAALAALGVADVAAFAAAAPEVLCEPPAALAARVAELTELTGLRPPALGALATRHPALLARPLGGSLRERASFWASVGVHDACALALAAPAALTASVEASLRPKVAFLQGELGLGAAEALARAPGVFGAVSLERTLRPRAAFLRALGVAPPAAAAALADWAEGDAEAFVAAAARLAGPGAAPEQVTLEAFRAHAAAAAPPPRAHAAADEDASS